MAVLRTRWAAQSRARRLLLAGVVAAAGLTAGFTLDGSTSKPPPPVVWRDHLADQGH
ncbi:MAG TPA: hypothetical protein VHL53_24130 [Acidimicrobiia bacterium]|nr:hypothetical protein [Acidimicrobiia bacterium]